MARLVLPDPCLVVLVGASGSGKTTFAARHFDPADVLASDAYRALVSGDEADQAATRPAFAILHRELDRRLRAGRRAVVDATNAQPHARRALVSRARRAGVAAAAIVFDLPRDVVQARNAARPGRVVEADVVDRHLDAVRAALADGRLTSEGFAPVLVMRSTEEIDALELAFGAP